LNIARPVSNDRAGFLLGKIERFTILSVKRLEGPAILESADPYSTLRANPTCEKGIHWGRDSEAIKLRTPLQSAS